MLVTKTTMNPAQIAFMAELEAAIVPIQAEIDAIESEEAALKEQMQAVRARKADKVAERTRYALIKPAVMTTHSRLKYFPEFYGLTADEVDQDKISRMALVKDTPEDIDRFIADAKGLLS